MGRVAIVTGGTRGIGEAISVALKDAGYTVVAIYAGNEEAASRFNSKSGISVYKLDVSDFEACETAARQIEADLGPVEVLVNNAGKILYLFKKILAKSQGAKSILIVSSEKSSLISILAGTLTHIFAQIDVGALDSNIN